MDGGIDHHYASWSLRIEGLKGAPEWPEKGMVPPGTNRYSGGSTVCDATPQAVPMAAAGRPQPVACDRVQVETVG